MSLRILVLMLSAACALASDLAAQQQPIRRVRDRPVTVRLGRTGVDTVSPRERLRQRADELIVNVTDERPGLVRPPAEQPAPGVRRPGATLPDQRSERADDPAPPAPEKGSADFQRPSASQAAQAGGEEDARMVYEIARYELRLADAESGGQAVLVPLVEIEGGGLQYDHASQEYVGTILIGLVNQQQPYATGAVPGEFAVLITGDVSSQPPLKLEQVNAWKQVTLRVRRPRGDSVRVRIRATFDVAGGDVISVPVLRAPFTVRAAPRRIAGFGLEISDVAVQATRPGDTTSVIVSSDHANPKPRQLKATNEGAVSRVRSAGVGADTVKVTSRDYEEMVVLQYAWPVAFLLSALLGGLFGGAVNALSASRRADGHTLLRLAAQGALTGIVGAVLYAVGINVVGWAPSAEYGEALMFAVAFMAGLVGPRIFDRFLPKVGGTRDDGDDADEDKPAPPSTPAEPAAQQPATV